MGHLAKLGRGLEMWILGDTGKLAGLKESKDGSLYLWNEEEYQSCKRRTCGLSDRVGASFVRRHFTFLQQVYRSMANSKVIQ
jgi:hypothetical protein